MMTDSHDVRRVCLRVGQAGASGAVALPILPPCFKFTITSTMIQLLNLKGMFRGEVGDDENQHRMNFVAICKSRKIPRSGPGMISRRLSWNDSTLNRNSCR
ncbi:hypothetical protein KY289_036120 [Solanum tuberosum]|nr:hypothetical protein KY289_036120 [Solanum tuberosum]